MLKIATALLILALQGLRTQRCLPSCSCYKDKKSLVTECSHISLNSLPQDYKNSTKCLRANSNNITFLRSRALANSGFFGLEVLMLRDNKISFIEEQAFEGIENLLELDLRTNLVTELLPGMFSGLYKLKYLDVGENHIGILRKGILQDMRLLYELSMSSNSISVIEDGAFERMFEIVFLDMRDNDIGILTPSILDGLEYVRMIDFGENKIEFLEGDLFKNLPMLREIYLDGNYITEIESTAFKGLRKLQRLSLERNEIQVIEQNTFEDLPSLTVIYTFRNKLTKLDANVWTDVRAITDITLRENLIHTWVENTFWGLRNLYAIDLGSNMIEVVPWNAFINVTKLTNVNLFNNSIKELNPQTFRYTNIRYLNLARNKILSLGPYLLSHQRRLTKVWLGENGLSFIHPDAFRNSFGLVEISLDNNRLRTLSKETFSGLKILSTVVLSNNTLDCDCNMRDTWSWFQKHVMNSGSQEMEVALLPECEKPREFKGKTWNVLKDLNCNQDGQTKEGIKEIEEKDGKLKNTTELKNNKLPLAVLFNLMNATQAMYRASKNIEETSRKMEEMLISASKFIFKGVQKRKLV